MIHNIFVISLSLSPIILLLIILSPALNRRYNVGWRYYIWLFLAVRLIVPFKFQFPDAPINIPAPQNQTIVFRQEGTPLTLADGDSINDNTSPLPADYSKVISTKSLLTIIWLIGAVSFFVFHIGAYFLFKSKTKPYCKIIDKEIYNTLLKDMKIKGNPNLLMCSKITSPMMIGFFKTTILLPRNDYSKDELAVILKHELTHYKRGDLWYKLLLVIANSVHWFNPVVYFMTDAANRDLEYSCDDAVVKRGDIYFRKAYSMTILKSMAQKDKKSLTIDLKGDSENE